MDFLLFPAIGHQLLHHIKVHQWLPAEKVNLQVTAAARIGNQEIQGCLADLIGHKGAPAMVFPFLRKAITAGQVAVMGNMQAQSLDHSGALLKLADVAFIFIFRKELAGIRQGLYLPITFNNIRLRIALHKLVLNFLPCMGLVQGD